MPKASSAKAAEVNVPAPASSDKAYTGEKIVKPLDNGGGSGIMNTNKKYSFVAHSKHINDFGKYPTYTNEEIRTELFKSTVGRRAVEYINDNSIYVEFDYTPICPIGEKGWYFGGIIHVYMGNCNNIKDIAKVIIHETTHSWIDSYQNSLREEFYCRIQEYYHTQNTLSLGELLKIARDVQEDYKHQGMKWREPNGYKRRGYDKEN